MSLRNEQDIINVMRTTVDQGTKTGAKIEYRFGEVADMDADTASVYLDGNITASTGFRIPIDMKLDTGDHVRVAISYGSNLGKWVEEIMQCEDRQTDGGCTKVVSLLPSMNSDLSMGHGHGEHIYVSDGSDLARYRSNLELIYHKTSLSGANKIERYPSDKQTLLKGDHGYNIYTGNVSWNISGSTTVLDFAFMEVGDERFWVTTDDSKLQKRDTIDGSLKSSISLSSNGTEIRRSPSGQYVAVRQGTGTIKVYDKKLALEQTISITSFFPNDDWNIDEAFNVYRIYNGTLKKWNKGGSTLFTKDVAADHGYKWPSRMSFGTGQQLVIDDFVRLVGYIGDSDWTAGSEGVVLTLARNNGDLKMKQRYGGDSGDGAQIMALRRVGDCVYVAGAATGNNFEETSLGSVIKGFVMRLAESIVASGDAGGGEGGDDPSHSHTLDSLSDAISSSPYAPSDGQVLTWSDEIDQWRPEDPSGTSVASIDDLDDVDTTTTPPADGDVLTWVDADNQWEPVSPYMGGGGGTGWTTIIDENGTSVANWTSIAGTWSSDGTNIKQTSTAASFARIYYTTKLRLVPAMIRWEFRFDSGGSGDDYAGMSIGTTGASGGAAVRPEIVSGVSQLRIEADDGAGQTDLYGTSDGVPTWVRGTWYAMEVLFDGFTTTIWVNGTLIGTNRVLLPNSRLYNYFRLLTHSAAVDFRNITVQTLDLPT